MIKQQSLFDQQPERASPEAFEKYHADNPQVWEKFKDIALELIDLGLDHYGAKAIFEILRYRYTIETKDPNFKLNNNYTAYYARKFIKEYPQHADFFETRRANVCV